MKKRTKWIMTGAVVGTLAVGAVIVNKYISIQKTDDTVTIIGGSDGPTSIFLAGKLSGGKSQYALYPVWILNTTWKGEKYIFAMNGQTGKMTGDLPIDEKIYLKWLAGLTAGFTVLAYLVEMLIF